MHSGNVMQWHDRQMHAVTALQLVRWLWLVLEWMDSLEHEYSKIRVQQVCPERLDFPDNTTPSSAKQSVSYQQLAWQRESKGQSQYLKTLSSHRALHWGRYYAHSYPFCPTRRLTARIWATTSAIWTATVWTAKSIWCPPTEQYVPHNHSPRSVTVPLSRTIKPLSQHGLCTKPARLQCWTWCTTGIS